MRRPHAVPSALPRDAATLHKYRDCFSNLRVKYDAAKGKAPHKPILLLALIDEVGRGHIAENCITLTDNLIASVLVYWQTLPTGGWQLLDGSQPAPVANPFYYLANDTCPQGGKFWFLVKNGAPVPATDANKPRSLHTLRVKIDYAQFAPDLWELLQDAAARADLRLHLLETYFSITPARVQPFVPADPLATQLDKLIAQAQSQPRPKTSGKVKEGDVDYLRHNLFPKVMYAVYDNACAVCGLRVQIGGSRVLAASHIKPFHLFHDDHPSNGLALCLNHHWAFDGGGFSVADNYTLLVSPQLTGTAGFVTPGASILLPTLGKCWPDPAALLWHRAHIFKP